MTREGEPFFFGPTERSLFGWFHPVKADGLRGAVVLCNPFGFEAICMHRSLRHFAETFARKGFASLRFDYDGTGDSAGSDRDPERVGAWLRSIHQAMDVLEERTGLPSVHLFGIRLGATLAVRAATSRSDCAGLIAIAPVVSPALYLRELAAFHAWSRLEKSPDGVTGIDPGDQEATGFVIKAATAAALSELALGAEPSPPAPRVLVIEPDKRASSTPWVKSLEAKFPLGVSVDVRRMEGFVGMSAFAHKSVLPTQMIATCAAWLEAGAPAARSTAVLAPSAPSAPSAPCTECSPAVGVVESAVFIDDPRRLFGVLARPSPASRAASARHAVVLLNAGAEHRIGPNRLWVALSRHWAKAGVVVLRLDLSGLGDSPAHRGRDENEVYGEGATADIAAASAYLRRELGATKVDVIGFCGSGTQAVRAAVKGIAVDSVLSINQQVFVWEWKVTRHLVATKAKQDLLRLRQAIRNPSSWEKLLRGEVDARAAVRSARTSALALASSRWREVARRLGVQDDLAADLRTIARRKVRLGFLFSDKESGKASLFELGGATTRELVRTGAISLEKAPGADHTFTAVWMHRLFRERLDTWLGIAGDGAAAEAIPEAAELRLARTVGHSLHGRSECSVVAHEVSQAARLFADAAIELDAVDQGGSSHGEPR